MQYKIDRMIKMHVIGHLGKDCQVNQVNEKNVMNFSVAHSEKYRDVAGETKEQVVLSRSKKQRVYRSRCRGKNVLHTMTSSARF